MAGLTCCQEAVKGNGRQAQESAEALKKATNHQHVAALPLRQVSSKGRHKIQRRRGELRPFWQLSAFLIWLTLCARAVPAALHDPLKPIARCAIITGRARFVC